MATPGALNATNLQYAEIGCWCWSRTRGHEGVHEDGSQVDPVGGLVLDVSEMFDDATGEIVRAFVVADTWRGRLRLRRMPESEVDRDLLEAAGSGEIGRVVRQLCEQVALTDRRRLRTGTFMPEHVTMLTYAHRLAGLLS